MKTVKRNNLWFPSLLDELFTENRLDVPNYENFSTPAVNISENFQTFVIEMAIPGFKKENIAIEIEKEVLKVSSNFAPKQSSNDTEKNKNQFTRKEFSFGKFSRTFILPDTVKKDDINANFEDGILTVSLPKLEAKEDIKKMVEIS
ncbi:MAG: Hsp20/alpha crystallin family protein [Bacteroidetes bacterium]|nr:Hsp20/alpha crystallin family protein [Bacteroidota bacterium]